MHKLTDHGALVQFAAPRYLLLTSMGNILSQVQLDTVLRPSNLILLALTLYGVRVARQALKVRGQLASIGFLPGTRYMYGPSTILGQILPPIPYISRTRGRPFAWKHLSD
jgi:hypothetical protein